MHRFYSSLAIGILTTVIGGFILAVLVSECRDIKQMHDTLILLEKKQNITPPPQQYE